ncbi:MAG: VOC family protein [Oscillospiraceae bacterium]|nr:VOC family protein [Oscillospiraceae bacterium]
MKIDHIAMYVNDLEAAKDFFVKYFGASSCNEYYNRKTGFRSYFLSFDEGARLEIMNRPNMTDSKKDIYRTGYVHMALGVGSRERVEELTDKLREDGFEIISGARTTGDGYFESCVVGIEGNIIEITV